MPLCASLVTVVKLEVGKDHVVGPSTCTKATLALWEKTLLHVSQQAIEKSTSCQNLE